MHKYFVTGPSITVPGGNLVSLNKEQAAQYAHKIKATGEDGVYLAEKSLLFTNGEEFGCSVDLSNRRVVQEILAIGADKPTRVDPMAERIEKPLKPTEKV